MPTEVLVRIEAPHFVAGLIARDGRVVRSAPILWRLRGMNGQQVADHCARMQWRWEVVHQEA